MIPNRMYEFTPPNGDPSRPIVVLGLQDYSPGQTQKTDIWKLDLPAEHAAQFAGHVEFDSYKSKAILQGDEAVASARLIPKKFG